MARILIVDDEEMDRLLLAEVLQEAGHELLFAPDGQQALSMLCQRKPDVMILDLIMPGMDGLQVLREKSLDPSIREIPVIVISASDPTGEPIVSDTLTVTQSGGLSVRDLLACIQAVSAVLAPAVRSGDRGQRERLVA